MRKNLILPALTLLSAALLSGSVPAQAAYNVEDPDYASSDIGSDFTFADLEDWSFAFSSGVGGWGTSLWIYPDGTFGCSFHDSDMGDTGEGYPNGTVYISDCTGTFTEPEYLNDYTYCFQIKEMELNRTPGEEEIVDGVRYIYSEPYGLDDAEDFYVYLPGAPLDELPEDFLSWVHYYDLSETEDTVLPFYGIYNVKQGEGFYGFILDEMADGPESEPGFIETEILYAQSKSEELKAELYSGYQSQVEMNLTSYELYQVWDTALNNIWGYLKECLDPDTMSDLTQEEIQWIHDKEAAVKAAGLEVEGGSMQPLLENGEASRWTEERVYELQSRFGDSSWSFSYSDEEYGAAA